MARPDNSINTQKSLNGVDLFKFICAFFVALLHLHFLENEAPAASFWLTQYLCRLGAPYFFVAGGYLLFRGTDPDHFSMERPLRYIRKVLRIYLIWTAIYFIPTLAYQILPAQNPGRMLLFWLRDTVFVGSYTHLWYLNATIFSVLLISLLLKRGKSLGFILILSGLLYCVGLTGQAYYVVWTPVRENLPGLWTVLDAFKWIIPTTRCGLFEGFFLMSLGLYTAVNQPKLNLSKTCGLFVLFMALWAGEVWLVNSRGWNKAQDMYIFMVPAVLFFFRISLLLPLKDRPVYKELRESSMLIYYIHLFVFVCTKKFFATVWGDTPDTVLRFIIVMGITYALTLAIKKLSRTEKFRGLSILFK